MPRTRHSIERDEKVGQIVEAAAKRLRDGGYPALSVAAIARELGLSPNSIYWYFPTKDDLFVAAIRGILAEILAAKPPRARKLETRILWFVEQLDGVEHLRSALYERAASSPTVAAFVEELEGGQRQMLANALRGRVADEELEDATEMLLATIQGAAVRKISGAARRRLIGYAVRAVTAGDAGT